MTYSEDDWRKAITRLIQMTSNGELSWAEYPDFKADAWTEVDRAFACKLKDKKYVVAAIRTRHYVDEEEFFWVNGVAFAVYKAGFADLFIGEAPRTLSVLDSLLSVVTDSFVFSQNALGDLLD